MAIAVGIVAASYGSLLAVDFSVQTFKLASFVLVPAMAISGMGLWDDLKGLEPWPRLVAQTFTGIIVAVILAVTDTMGFAFNNHLLNYFITVLWIVGVCNSINFFDNHDGGAAGTVAVITFFLFFIAYDRQQILVSALAIVTAGATAGFLMGLSTEKDAAIMMQKWQVVVTLVITVIILTPSCYYLARWMERVSYGKYLNQLRELIQQFEKDEVESV